MRHYDSVYLDILLCDHPISDSLQRRPTGEAATICVLSVSSSFVYERDTFLPPDHLCFGSGD